MKVALLAGKVALLAKRRLAGPVDGTHGRWPAPTALVAAFSALVPITLVVAAPAQAQWFSDKEGPSIAVQDSAKSGERIHVVEQGDTLWSIAEQLYDDPWYWPSLWSYNPQVTNPHQIYPGDVLYLSRRAPPTKAAAAKPVTHAQSRYQTPRRPQVELVRRVGYISSRDYRESGTVEASREERNMLGQLDEAYVRFSMRRCSEETAAGRDKDPDAFTGPCVRDGDRHTLYRVEREVVHPLTNKIIGYKINFLGEGKVLRTVRPLASVLITRSYSEISRGDLVTNVFEPLVLTRAATNKVELVATIVDFHHETSAAAQYHYVYIDKGADDGVEKGNRFEIMWRGDGLRRGQVGNLKDYPDEQIGIATVIEAYDRHCLAVLTASVREIERGMPAVMAKGF
ncbi:MAG: LysM peptidoglycan-binding domain-containing protein [Myxococcales bacterium]|nr:LysM peptidoglycan-binding domain-containing protein [Myxococcales bacterium]